jgi:myo-inositol 2-dehydrogenase/D-chiro-inositol 1-dehydrogenase
MSDTKKPSRRQFLKTTAVASAGAALAGGLGVARSAHAQGSDVIKVALIGCGGRGNGAAGNCLEANPAIRIVAVADAFEDKARGAAERLRRQGQDIPDERVFAGLDAFRKAVNSGVDMVIIATPPGFRPIQYKTAVEAGKHVFMEKPCCVDGPGYRMLVEANKLADQKGLKVGVGLQRHHQAGYIQGIQEIKDGALGDILLLRAYWNGGGIWNRGREDWMNELQYQVNNWYHFVWLSGDNICEQHVHNLDVCNWVKGDHPVEANGMGGCTVRYAGAAKGTGQIFDHHFVEFTYGDGSKMYSQCRHMPNTWGNVSEAVHGTKGARGVSVGGGPQLDSGNPYVQEHIDLIKAIRNGTPYNEGHYGADSSMTAVLGRMANYSGQVIKWDDAVSKGRDEAPDIESWDAEPPVAKNENGDYPIPIPGVYKAF